MEAETLDVLSGIVEDVSFRREDTGFTVLDISTEEGELITVVGILPEISAGENVTFTGNWGYHVKFGKQFKAESCERSLPKSVDQMFKYLSSGAVKE